ncbi:hypothetical protein VII00023_12116 [Vibrio ichthyoenteri ATCC 700023]|uniref:Metallo-beta-lactamase domain-containing protein n=1 Tax=Vibrio ichthyoenteri ATCC 700023 TaxID=870968 RepID=F9RYQ6_9VIBR|nr:MBL fold metallo-hydrolase [Vibrio ichthyoenteri]EGU46332.1 hypothetical protein VII00023_12116 [Vibrio ichthyoenteri ATCC 700023]
MKMDNREKTALFSMASMMGWRLFEQTKVNQASQESENLRKQRVANSPQFHQGRVISNMPNVPTTQSMSEIVWAFLFKRSTLKPTKALPYQIIKPSQFSKPHKVPRVTWLGHSSLYVEMDGQKLLIEPVFEYASPWIAKRLFARNVAAPIKREDLPIPDAIVISHDHYDHLEESTIRYYVKYAAQNQIRFIVPLAVGRHLERWGVAPAQIEELDWWQSTLLGSIEITATPANHNSGRTGLDSNKTLWASWALKGHDGSLFYSGDSAYDDHFKQIGQRLGPFDMAFVEVAANVKDGQGFPVENWGHMQAKHTIRAFADLNAKQLMPVHWSTYELFSHRWDEPIEDLLSEAQDFGTTLVTPMVGQSFEVGTENLTDRWWYSPQVDMQHIKLTCQS